MLSIAYLSVRDSHMRSDGDHVSPRGTAAGVKKVVLTSSCSALRAYPKTGLTLDDTMWNETSKLEEEPYMASKTAAERSVGPLRTPRRLTRFRRRGAQAGVGVLQGAGTRADCPKPGLHCRPHLRQGHGASGCANSPMHTRTHQARRPVVAAGDAQVSDALEVFVRLLSGKIPLAPNLHYTFVDARDLAEVRAPRPVATHSPSVHRRAHQAHIAAIDSKADGRRFVIGNAEVCALACSCEQCGYRCARRQDGAAWIIDVANILRKHFPAYPLPTRTCPNFLVYVGALFEPKVNPRPRAADQ
jgi:hypothetical protein